MLHTVRIATVLTCQTWLDFTRAPWGLCCRLLPVFPAEPSHGHVNQTFAPYVGTSPPPTHPTLHKLAGHTKGSNGLITAAGAEDDSRYLRQPLQDNIAACLPCWLANS